MVWYISVRSKLRLRGCEVFGHDITGTCTSDFTLVLLFLIVSPGVLPIFLLLGQNLIISYEIFKLLALFSSHLVFKHTSHTGHVIGLVCIFWFFVDIVLIRKLLLTNLLLNPSLLYGLVDLLSLSISYRNVKSVNNYLPKSSPSNYLQPEMYSGTYFPARSDLSVTLFIFFYSYNLLFK